MVLPKCVLNKKLTIDEKELIFEFFIESFRYPITAALLVFACYTQFTIYRLNDRTRMIKANPSYWVTIFDIWTKPTRSPRSLGEKKNLGFNDSNWAMHLFFFVFTVTLWNFAALNPLFCHHYHLMGNFSPL